MAFSLNKIMLIGNLGQDAETRFTTNNTEITSFSLATTHSYKGADGNYVNDTTWHNCIAFGLSDFHKNNLKKGKKFFIEGRLVKRNYENKEGQKIYITEVVVNKFELIPLDNYGRTSANNPQTYENENNNQDSPQENKGGEDDDLPF